MLKKFPQGPYETVRQDARTVVADTTVCRLLEWGQRPVASNRHNTDALIESLTHLAQNSTWYGMEMDRVLTLDGWPEGLDIAKRYAQELPSFTMPSIGRRRIWCDDGDEFCRDRFDAAQDNYWSSRRRMTNPSRPVLKFTCAVGGRSNRSAAQLVWLGAAAFALCDAAEAAGYRMEIEAISQTGDTFAGDSRLSVQRIKVKEADEPLNREYVVMALACPAFFRWHIIHARAAIAAELRVTEHYGGTMEIAAQYHGDLHMPHAYDEASARTAVQQLVNKIEQMAGEVATR